MQACMARGADVQPPPAEPGSETCCFLSHDCGKQYCVCVAFMRWCSNTKSVSQFVSHTCHYSGTYLVHTSMYLYVPLYLSCTGMYRYVRVCTGMYRYIPNTLFLYLWSRFQMMASAEPSWHKHDTQATFKQLETVTVLAPPCGTSLSLRVL